MSYTIDEFLEFMRDSRVNAEDVAATLNLHNRDVELFYDYGSGPGPVGASSEQVVARERG